MLSKFYLYIRDVFSSKYLLETECGNLWKNSNLNQSLYDASLIGRNSLVLYFISKGVNWWDWYIEGAALGGHIHLVKYYISKGATWLHWCMYSAIEKGHIDIIQYIIPKIRMENRNKLNCCIAKAKEAKHKVLVEYFKQKLTR